jgi:hypothetical protein
MNLLHLFVTALRAPGRAVDEVRARPGACWGFAVVIGFNLAVAFTTTLWLHLEGGTPDLPPVLPVIPLERYYLAEMLFLPPLRVGVWAASAAVIHLGLRVAKRRVRLTELLNLGALVNLVVMPFIFALDWSALALGLYHSSPFRLVHGTFALVLGGGYTTFGVRRLSGAPTWLSLALVALSVAVTVPVLALVAR